MADLPSDFVSRKGFFALVAFFALGVFQQISVEKSTMFNLFSPVSDKVSSDPSRPVNTLPSGPANIHTIVSSNDTNLSPLLDRTSKPETAVPAADNSTQTQPNQLIILKPFSKWSPGSDLPCFPLEKNWNRGFVQRSRATKGIFFVKTPKAGSTTGSSVTLRIATTLAARHNTTLCKNRLQHTQVYKMGYQARDRTRSILWSLVREPTSRAVSQAFHFHFSRRSINATDENFIKFITDRESMFTSFQVKYLALSKLTDDMDPLPAMNRILRSYDFIGVMERMDESAVALQMILGLEPQDILYLSAKSSGGYDDGRYDRQCTFIQKSFVSPGMRKFFASERWQKMIYWDGLFYNAVNQTLDLTIDQLGRDEFAHNLATFRRLKEQVASACADKVKMPCSAKGKRLYSWQTDCIYDDMGCGFDCMKEVLGY